MEQPIFIVGTMRSGSTLLRLVLDSHERIAIGPETGFVRAVPFIRHLPPWTSGAGWYRRLGTSDEEMNAHIARFFAGLFRERAEAQGKVRWGDKTPNNVEQMALLRELFPAAIFVGIVRHPGAVAASLMRRGRTFEEAVQLWVDRNNDLMARGEALGTNFALIRYEDLVERPELLLPRLLDYLGEPWDDAVLDHDSVQAAKGAPRITDGGTRTSDPMDPSRVDRWRGALTPRQHERLRDYTAGLLPLFGYTAHAVDDLAPDDLLIDGNGLAHRRARLGIRLQPAAMRTLRSPAARRWAQVRHASKLLFTDPADTIRRMGATVRDHTIDRDEVPHIDQSLRQRAADLLARETRKL